LNYRNEQFFKASYCGSRIVRKVKFILDWVTFLDLGKLCNQFLCVASFIISKLGSRSTYYRLIGTLFQKKFNINFSTHYGSLNSN